jgi:hypothetical protein
MAGDPQAGVVGQHLFPAVIGDLLAGRESPDGGRDLYVEMVRGVQRARRGQSLTQHLMPLGQVFEQGVEGEFLFNAHIMARHGGR